jgi:hypothetical protein
MLILVLGMALGMGLVCILFVAHMLRQRSHHASGIGRYDILHEDPHLHGVVPLPATWIAVRSDNPARVQAALGLLTPKSCSWEEGLAAALDDKLFVSAPIRGWVLVMGAGLPNPFEDVDDCFRIMLALSCKVGRLQLFSANRSVHHHAWVLASYGSILRAYAWAGRTLWNQGRLTRAERELQIRCFSYTDEPESNLFSSNDTAAANTEKLPLLAARWSLDPAGIDAQCLRQSHGVAGELPKQGAF